MIQTPFYSLSESIERYPLPATCLHTNPCQMAHRCLQPAPAHPCRRWKADPHGRASARPLLGEEILKKPQILWKIRAAAWGWNRVAASKPAAIWEEPHFASHGGEEPKNDLEKEPELSRGKQQHSGDRRGLVIWMHNSASAQAVVLAAKYCK